MPSQRSSRPRPRRGTGSDLARSQVFLMMGRKWSGKSHKLGQLLVRLLRVEGRDQALIHDPKPTNQFGATTQDLPTFLRTSRPSRLTRLRAKPVEIARTALALGGGGARIAVVFDEIDRATTAEHFANTDAARASPIYKLVHEGRHFNLDLLGGARRPVSVHPDVRSQGDIFWFFQTSEPNDLRWIKELDGRLPVLVRALDFDRHECLRYVVARQEITHCSAGELV